MDVKTTFRNLVRDQSVSICMLHQIPWSASRATQWKHTVFHNYGNIISSWGQEMPVCGEFQLQTKKGAFDLIGCFVVKWLFFEILKLRGFLDESAWHNTSFPAEFPVLKWPQKASYPVELSVQNDYKKASYPSEFPVLKWPQEGQLPHWIPCRQKDRSSSESPMLEWPPDASFSAECPLEGLLLNWVLFARAAASWPAFPLQALQ